MESSRSQVPTKSDDTDFAFGYDDPLYSDRTLQIEIVPNISVSETDPDDGALIRNKKRHCPERVSNDHELLQTNVNQYNTADRAMQVKTVNISALLLAGKSQFFRKLFSNGMLESGKKHVTIQIQELEEAAFMDMLKFMYDTPLSNTTPKALLEIIMIADKYEVPSCIKYCLSMLTHSPMTYETASLCLDLPSKMIMEDEVQLLKNIAKNHIVRHFQDISESEVDMRIISLVGIVEILSCDDLAVNSEDDVYDFVMNWTHTHYTDQNERKEILNTRLLHLIRAQYMSCGKLKELQSSTDIDPKYASELLHEALSFQMLHVSSKKERNYILRPVNVIIFKSPVEKCEVYLDLRREECERLLPNGYIHSRDFHFGGKTFFFEVERNEDIHLDTSFGLYMCMRETARVEYEFCARTNTREEFVIFEELAYEKGEVIHGHHNMFQMPWEAFIDENSKFFINGILHLHVVIKLNE